MTHGDLDLEARVDFLAVVERRLIPARLRSEWDTLRRKGLASVWAPACQDLQKIAAHQITASDLKTFTNTFLVNMRMKFIMTTT